MSPAGLEPTIPACQRQQTRALDRAVAGTGLWPTAVAHLLAVLIAECWLQIWIYVRPNSIFFRNLLIFDIARGQHFSARSVNQNRLIICRDKCILAKKCNSEGHPLSVALPSEYVTLQILCSAVSGSFTVACRTVRLTCWSPEVTICAGKVYGGLKLPCPDASRSHKDLSPCEFDLIPKMKEPLRGIRFRTVPEILQAVDRSIRTIHTTGAAKGILRLPHRWQRFVNNAGDYTEGQ